MRVLWVKERESESPPLREGREARKDGARSRIVSRDRRRPGYFIRSISSRSFCSKLVTACLRCVLLPWYDSRRGCREHGSWCLKFLSHRRPEIPNDKSPCYDPAPMPISTLFAVLPEVNSSRTICARTGALSASSMFAARIAFFRLS